MNHMPALTANLDTTQLLKEASFRAACCLGIERGEIDKIISENRTGYTDQKRCLLFIRISRALDNVFCGNIEAERSWLNTENPRFDSKPLDLLSSLSGLAVMVEYLEEMVLQERVECSGQDVSLASRN